MPKQKLRCAACVRTARAVRTKRSACPNVRTVRGFDSAPLASFFIACRTKSALGVATIVPSFGRRDSRAGLAVRRLRLNSESDVFHGRRL